MRSPDAASDSLRFPWIVKLLAGFEGLLVFVASWLLVPYILAWMVDPQAGELGFGGIVFLIGAWIIGLLIAALVGGLVLSVTHHHLLLRLLVDLLAAGLLVLWIQATTAPKLPENETALHEAVRSGDVAPVATSQSASAPAPDLEARNSLGQTPLLLAVELAAWDVTQPIDPVRHLLERGADVNARDPTGKTALISAVRRPELLDLVIAHGADPNLAYRPSEAADLPCDSLWTALQGWPADKIIAIADRFPTLRQPLGPDGTSGNGPLQAVTRRSDTAVLVEYFLKRGFNARDKMCGLDYTPLHNVVQWSKEPSDTIRAIDLLLAAGADLEAKHEGQTPLMFAGSQVELVQHLIAQGAEVNAIEGGDSVLDKYLEWKHEAAAAVLRAAGGKRAEELRQTGPRATGGRLSPPLKGETPLHAAVRETHAFRVNQLLAEGADLDAPNAKGQTALMIAVELAATGADSRVDLVRHLLDLGAKVDARDNLGKTALIYAATDASLLTLLAAHGADPSLGYSIPREGHIGMSVWNQLWTLGPDGILAVAEKFPEPLRLPTDLEGRSGGGPLHLYLYLGMHDRRLVEYFLGRGFKADDADREGHTPLHRALEADSADPAATIAVIDLLLAAGAKIDARTASGWTPLMVARQRPALVQHLIDRGADVNATVQFDGREQSVLDLYESAQQAESIARLRKAGARRSGEVAPR